MERLSERVRRIETERTVGVPGCRRNSEKQKLDNEKRGGGRRKQKYYSRKAGWEIKKNRRKERETDGNHTPVQGN